MRCVRRCLPVCVVLACVGCAAIAPGEAARPDWVRSIPPESGGGHLWATGAAPPARDAEAALREAERAARDRLAEVVAAHTEAMLTAFFEARPDYGAVDSPAGRQFISVTSGDVVSAVLRQARRQDVWQSDDGEVHVLYRMPLVELHREITSRSEDALPHVDPFRGSAQQGLAQLSEFLDQRLQQRMRAEARRPPLAGEPPPEEAPAWLESGRHENYPRAEYWSAIGLGADPQSADAAARAEMAVAVRTELARQAQELASAGGEKPLDENLRWFDPARLRIAPTDLVAVRLAERWHDPVTESHYALAVLDRSTADLMYRRRIEEAAERSAERLAAARNNHKAENYAEAIADYGAAVAAARRAFKDQLAALVVATEPKRPELRELLAEPILAQAKGELQALLDEMKLEPVLGDGQWMPPGVPPAGPLVATLTAGQWERPVADVPVRLLVDPTDETSAVAARTDEFGAALWQLAEPPPPQAPKPAMVAELDLHALAPGADGAGLSVPSAEFTYVLRSRANSRFVVHVHERTADGALVPTPMSDALARALTEEGYQLVDRADVLKHAPALDLPAGAPAQSVLQGFAGLSRTMPPGQFLLLVYGQVEVREEETAATTEGKLHIVACSYALRALDAALPGPQKVVLSLSGTARGAYLDDLAEARGRAEAEASGEAAQKLTGGLAAKLGDRGAP